MANVNEAFLKLKNDYLFSTILEKKNEFLSKNPKKKVISLGVGDVTLPLVPSVIDAMHKATEEMAKKETFQGYGLVQGYDFLIEKIIKYEYEKRGVSIDKSEVFVAAGSKGDLSGIAELFSKDSIVALMDPVYPAYRDTNIMLGRDNIKYLETNAENGFIPEIPHEDMDIIYLCSPNNPTGAVYSHGQLKKWVDFALNCNAVILFDSAYGYFIKDSDLPSSIFEVEGADKCAIEICSFSKSAGFTGTRCGYTIISNCLEFDGQSINKMWRRRLAAKFNGVSYIVQRGAAAIFTEKGQSEIFDNINYYRENAKFIANALKDMDIYFTGGENSPYIWLKCPNKMTSWQFFDYLLNEANIVGTPGSGFGEKGEGFLRLTAFGDRENTKEAVERLKKLHF